MAHAPTASASYDAPIHTPTGHTPARAPPTLCKEAPTAYLRGQCRLGSGELRARERESCQGVGFVEHGRQRSGRAVAKERVG